MSHFFSSVTPSVWRANKFFILGAEKCGTTSLYAYLEQHPDVCFSIPKEPIFFEAEYDKGLDYYYQTYFFNWKGQHVVGDARHRNLYLPYIPERIAHSLNNPKFIVIVRNPVDRAYSNWLGRYTSSERLETLSFEDAIFEDLKRIESEGVFEGERGAKLWRDGLIHSNSIKGVATSKLYRTYVDGGYYSLQIHRYLNYFSMDQMRIVYFEDLVKNPQQVVSDLWTFLGVASEFKLIDLRPRNVSSRSFVRARLWQNRNRLKFFRRFPKQFKNLSLNLLERLVPPIPEMSREIRKFLQEHYYEHNRDLEKLCNRDLRHWDG